MSNFFSVNSLHGQNLQVQTADDAGELSDLGSQDDDEDDEKLFRTNSDAVVDDTADVLSQTQTNLNSLEETLHGLEDWLESKVGHRI